MEGPPLALSCCWQLLPRFVTLSLHSHPLPLVFLGPCLLATTTCSHLWLPVPVRPCPTFDPGFLERPWLWGVSSPGVRGREGGMTGCPLANSLWSLCTMHPAPSPHSPGPSLFPQGKKVPGVFFIADPPLGGAHFSVPPDGGRSPCQGPALQEMLVIWILLLALWL